MPALSTQYPCRSSLRRSNWISSSLVSWKKDHLPDDGLRPQHPLSPQLGGGLGTSGSRVQHLLDTRRRTTIRMGIPSIRPSWTKAKPIQLRGSMPSCVIAWVGLPGHPAVSLDHSTPCVLLSSSLSMSGIVVIWPSAVFLPTQLYLSSFIFETLPVELRRTCSLIHFCY